MTYQLGTAGVLLYGLMLLIALADQLSKATGNGSRLYSAWSYFTALNIAFLLFDLITEVAR